MGNREDLLTGAKRCLTEKGFTRTTTRDIGAAASVSTAAIGYHFGSKEALLTEAFVEMQKEWGDQMAATAVADWSEQAEPAERFAALWTQILRSFVAQRDMWAITLEILAQTDQPSKARELLIARQNEARDGLFELIGQALAIDRSKAAEVGWFYETVLSGLMVQSLTHPKEQPTGEQLVSAMRTVVQALDR